MVRRSRGRGSRYDSDDYGGFPPYVPVAARRAQAAAAARKLAKGGRELLPVTVAGRKIATTWWGTKWNENLERYADYANRIDRGRSYVRNGSVIDLRIEGGMVKALVSGSRSTPYKVEVNITKLADANWRGLCGATDGLESLPDLLAGRFSPALQARFFASGTGLFPAPKEIHFTCSCPDWASMCKHVAAVLYGVGNRLDAEPRLLFSLRQVTVEELVRHSVGQATRGLLNRAAQASGDGVLDDADLSDVFGIELDAAPTPAAPPARAAARSAARKPAPAPAPKTPPKTARKAAAKGAAVAAGSGTMVDHLLAALPKARRRLTSAEIGACLPDWSKIQVANTIARAVREGRLERVEPGVYRRAKA